MRSSPPSSHSLPCISRERSGMQHTRGLQILPIHLMSHANTSPITLLFAARPPQFYHPRIRCIADSFSAFLAIDPGRTRPAHRPVAATRLDCRCIQPWPRRGTVVLRRFMSSVSGAAGVESIREDVLNLPGSYETRHAGGMHGVDEAVAGIDIGGTLTKVVRLSLTADAASNDSANGSSATRQLSCRIWPTKHIDTCFSHLRRHSSSTNSGLQISATGGGALKYAAQLTDLTQSPEGDTAKPAVVAARSSFTTQDEMACLAAGLSFLQTNVCNELFEFDSSNMYPMVDTMDIPVSSSKISDRSSHPLEGSGGNGPGVEEERPTLLANIGTGVSFVLCPPRTNQSSSPANVEPARRVGGTPLSGTTLFGVLKLLTRDQSLTYTDILDLASRGDSRKVDLTVGDVYGSDYTGVGLSGHRAAGFLGRIATSEAQISETDTESGSGHNVSDVARSLVFAVGYNIGQQAVLQARLHDAAREVCFTGSFGSGHPLVMGAIDYAVRMNGEGRFVATFLHHESYLGAIGAWVLGAGSVQR